MVLPSGVGDDELSTWFANRKKIAHWADEFSKDTSGEMLLIICNKIVYGYIVNTTIKEINPPPPVTYLQVGCHLVSKVRRVGQSWTNK